VVQEIIERCWQGPPYADVSSINETPFEGEVEPGFRQI
jgi:hypothetical protein